ncbi:MAG: LamG domain-containing protein [Bacteroidales bacterium]|nr:LamG domain-containing protein [Bacteroidales bacterium]
MIEFMKKNYKTGFNKLCQFLMLALTGTIFLNVRGQDLPVPDVALKFEQAIADSNTYVSIISDASTDPVAHNALWYNWNDGDATLQGGFRPNSGYFGGGFYMSGMHACCEEGATSALDFILLAGSENEKDVDGYKEKSEAFHGDFDALSVMFWYKPDRKYNSLTGPCINTDDDGMSEKEVLFSMGKSNAGVLIHQLNGQYNVFIGHDESVNTPTSNLKIEAAIDNSTGTLRANEKAWQHVALVFSGASKEISFYLNGELAKSAKSSNPLVTTYSNITGMIASAELGAQQNAGLDGNPGDGWWKEDGSEGHKELHENASPLFRFQISEVNIVPDGLPGVISMSFTSTKTKL